MMISGYIIFKVSRRSFMYYFMVETVDRKRFSDRLLSPSISRPSVSKTIIARTPVHTLCDKKFFLGERDVSFVSTVPTSNNTINYIP